MKLPVYTNQGGITTDVPGNIRDIDAYSQMYKSLGNAAQNLLSLTAQWQQSKDEVENLDGKNKLVAEMTQILNEAEDYRDYNNFADLSNKENELLQRMYQVTPDIVNGFSNNQNAAIFQKQAELATLQNKEKLREIFRNKYVDNAKSNLITSQDSNMENYITTGNAAYKESYLQDLENMFRAGFIDEAYKTQMGLKTDEWETYHVLRQAESDPDTIINNLEAGKYNVAPEHYNDLLQDLTRIKTNQQLLREYEEISKQNKGEDEATNYIYGNTDYADKLKYINEQEFQGKISSKFAQQARRNIKQFKPNNEKTISEAQSVDEILRRAYDLNESGMSDAEYLKGIQNIRQDILTMQANGDISTPDAIKMNNQLNTVTNKKVSETTVQIANGYGAAKDYIDKVLPPDLRAEAIREVFYDTADKNTDNMDKETLNQLYYNSAIKAVEKINTKNRHKALNVKTGETKELTYFVDSRLPEISEKIGVKLTVTDRYAERNWKSEHTQGTAFDVSMSEHSAKNREKTVKALLESPEIKYVSTSDPNLLKKFKDNPKLRDFTSTDKKLPAKNNHINHIHVTVNTAETVKIKAPNGKIYRVPKDETTALVKDGGVILK